MPGRSMDVTAAPRDLFTFSLTDRFLRPTLQKYSESESLVVRGATKAFAVSAHIVCVVDFGINFIAATFGVVKDGIQGARNLGFSADAKRLALHASDRDFRVTLLVLVWDVFKNRMLANIIERYTFTAKCFRAAILYIPKNIWNTQAFVQALPAPSVERAERLFDHWDPTLPFPEALAAYDAAVKEMRAAPATYLRGLNLLLANARLNYGPTDIALLSGALAEIGGRLQLLAALKFSLELDALKFSPEESAALSLALQQPVLASSIASFQATSSVTELIAAFRTSDFKAFASAASEKALLEWLKTHSLKPSEAQQLSQAFFAFTQAHAQNGSAQAWLTRFYTPLMRKCGYHTTEQRTAALEAWMAEQIKSWPAFNPAYKRMPGAMLQQLKGMIMMYGLLERGNALYPIKSYRIPDERIKAAKQALSSQLEQWLCFAIAKSEDFFKNPSAAPVDLVQAMLSVFDFRDELASLPNCDGAPSRIRKALLQSSSYATVSARLCYTEQLYNEFNTPGMRSDQNSALAATAWRVHSKGDALSKWLTEGGEYSKRLSHVIQCLKDLCFVNPGMQAEVLPFNTLPKENDKLFEAVIEFLLPITPTTQFDQFIHLLARKDKDDMLSEKAAQFVILQMKERLAVLDLSLPEDHQALRALFGVRNAFRKHFRWSEAAEELFGFLELLKDKPNLNRVPALEDSVVRLIEHTFLASDKRECLCKDGLIRFLQPLAVAQPAPVGNIHQWTYRALLATVQAAQGVSLYLSG